MSFKNSRVRKNNGVRCLRSAATGGASIFAPNLLFCRARSHSAGPQWKAKLNVCSCSYGNAKNKVSRQRLLLGLAGQRGWPCLSGAAGHCCYLIVGDAGACLIRMIASCGYFIFLKQVEVIVTPLALLCQPINLSLTVPKPKQFVKTNICKVSRIPQLVRISYYTASGSH